MGQGTAKVVALAGHRPRGVGIGMSSVSKSGELDLNRCLVVIGQDRDRAAFAALFDHFAPRVKAYMIRLGADDAKAEDLAQETLLTVWRKAADYDPGKAGASTWIFTIARNLRIDAIRKERRPEVGDDELINLPDSGPLADVAVATGEDQRRVRIALKQLPSEQAEVVRLSFFEDMPHSAIAERLKLPLGTVKSRLRLAFKRVRNALGEDQ